MSNKPQIAAISNAQASSMGVILILFILLVIVTSLLNSNANRYTDFIPEDDSSSSSSASQTSFIINNQSQFNLHLADSNGNLVEPVPATIRSNSQSTIYVFGNGVNVSSGFARYEARSEGIPIGDVAFRMNWRPFFLAGNNIEIVGSGGVVRARTNANVLFVF
ncbi:hypothetical protein SAMN05444162_4271 [Paenibacillaceae bacterium GAS479]|nr:hypothetical protein SAMN05444162_4271 [Paenibacillaceae bacterium GAS479]